MGRQADLVGRALNKSIVREIKTLTLDITEGLIDGTPVDTGWARANWIPQIGDPFRDIVGDREAIDTSEQELGMAEVATQYDLLDGPIFISNNVPYIESLNEGSSDQAPAGFIEAVIEREVAKANQRILR